MKTYFHTSNDYLEKGTILKPSYGLKMLDPRVYAHNDHFHAQYLREKVIEEYRLENFPDKPSRLNSVYLFDDIRLAIQYQEMQKKQYLFAVEVDTESNFLKADMFLINLTVRKSIEEIRELASVYFKGGFTEKKNFEILCDGKVKILHEVKKFVNL